jgi:hypothetical protein
MLRCGCCSSSGCHFLKNTHWCLFMRLSAAFLSPLSIFKTQREEKTKQNEATQSKPGQSKAKQKKQGEQTLQGKLCKGGKAPEPCERSKERMREYGIQEVHIELLEDLPAQVGRPRLSCAGKVKQTGCSCPSPRVDTNNLLIGPVFN